jgi:hypothetical protein
MCKNLFKGLLGGGSSPTAAANPAVAQPAPTGAGSSAAVMNPDVVSDTSNGRVKLGTASKRQSGVAGLSI